MDFFRTKSKTRISTWDEKKLIILEITPALETAAKGQPKPGDIRFDKDKSCTISFHAEEAIKCAWYLSKLCNGMEVTYSKHADTSKVEGADGGVQKQLSIVKSKNEGGVMFSLKHGDRSATIILDYAETYVVQKYLESKALGYLA